LDKEEAREILRRELMSYRKYGREELMPMLDSQLTSVAVGPSGARYNIEVQVFWDDIPGGDIRVSGAIDDGGLSSFVPLADSFIVKHDGTIVG
jgi:hypothetical protein